MSTIRKSVLTIAAIAVSLLTLSAVAERGDDSDRASKNGKVEGTIDGVQVSLEYGRPKVKGRDIWGGLVPYGKIWRTGANEATTITVSADVMVEGQALAAGTYALFTVPEEGAWTVIFNKNAQQWGAYDYEEAQDALRVTVTPQTAEPVEEMDFEITEEGVVLRWETLSLPIQVSAAG